MLLEDEVKDGAFAGQKISGSFSLGRTLGGGMLCLAIGEGTRLHATLHGEPMGGLTQGDRRGDVKLVRP
jgi:hypothetical protein